MYQINNNAFSCVLKVVRLQSDIRNAVGKLFHTEGAETAKLPANGVPRTFSRSVFQSLPKLDDCYRGPFVILKYLLSFLYSVFRSKVIRAYNVVVKQPENSQFLGLKY